MNNPPLSKKGVKTFILPRRGFSKPPVNIRNYLFQVKTKHEIKRN